MLLISNRRRVDDTLRTCHDSVLMSRTEHKPRDTCTPSFIVHYVQLDSTINGVLNGDRGTHSSWPPSILSCNIEGSIKCTMMHFVFTVSYLAVFELSFGTVQ